MFVQLNKRKRFVLGDEEEEEETASRADQPGREDVRPAKRVSFIPSSENGITCPKLAFSTGLQPDRDRFEDTSVDTPEDVTFSNTFGTGAGPGSEIPLQSPGNGSIVPETDSDDEIPPLQGLASYMVLVSTPLIR
jgi:hypothetical protein